MSKLVRFLLISGFLGAGKTTTVARLARHYLDQGLQVGLVTNDQSNDLVDTLSLKSQGFLVDEVTGACFCSRFDNLIETLAELGEGRSPDVILAEPIGSGTDLTATIVEPLRRLHAERYTVGPLAVLLKPEHGLRILREKENAGFSPQAAYIFRKQIEEADIVVINKVDNLSDTERGELVQMVGDQYPDKRVLSISARRGDNFDSLIQSLEDSYPLPTDSLQLDYDACAAGEAELGWLNCQLSVRQSTPYSLDSLTLKIVTEFGAVLEANACEIAHVKALGQAEGCIALANQVAGDVDPELSIASQQDVENATVILNARVASPPSTIEAALREVLQRLGTNSIQIEVEKFTCFEPGRPAPTHRISLD